MPATAKTDPLEVGWTLRLAEIKPDSWRASSSVEDVATDTGSSPSRRFVKDIIRTGQYVKLADGLQFSVTPQTLSNWVMQFRRMKANGVKVSIPDGHDNEGVASKNLGWVEDMWIVENGETQTLMMSCRLIGKDAIETASRSDVSLNSPPVFVDGKGNIYSRPITHVAVCTDPVVPGLGEFVPLAASRRLGLSTGAKAMNLIDFVNQVAAMFGIDPATLPKDEKEAAQALLNMLAVMQQNGGGAPAASSDEGGATATGGPCAANGGGAKPSAGGIKKETLTREYAGAFSLNGKPSPMIVKTVAENRQMKIDRLITQGKLTPAAAQKLTDQFIGKDCEAVALSLSAGSDGSDFESVIAVLDANEPIVTFGGKTGPQTQRMALSDSSKGDGKPKTSPVVANAQARAAAAAR